MSNSETKAQSLLVPAPQAPPDGSATAPIIEVASPTHQAAAIHSVLTASNRIIETDKWIRGDIQDCRLDTRLFVRLGAKEKKLVNVDFKYSTFESCYMRDCTFDSCDFTGCKFVGTNFSGSTFIGCKFDYSSFERTLISDEILSSGCPSTENLIAKFARTLRLNFQQIGDSEAVNKAMSLELKATGIHLKKAWRSSESYYRKKYSGWKRAEMLTKWIRFRFLDLIWGNGERASRLAVTVLLIMLAMSFIDVGIDKTKSPWLVMSYVRAIRQSPQIFLGVVSPRDYSSWYLTIILFTRLVAFGLFLSIVIKRLNRR